MQEQEQEQAQEMQQKQEQKPAREQMPEQEQEHDPSKATVEINIPPNNYNAFRFFTGGGGGGGPPFNIRGNRLTLNP